MGSLGSNEQTLQPGMFVGREAEVSAAVRLLGTSTRLLTLTGPPGVGKTRLATEVADELRNDFTDGVLFVDLSAARDAATAINELVRQTGTDPTPTQTSRGVLHEWLAGRQLLLLLDNAEQVDGLADEIPDLLERGRDMCILVTSRESLHLEAERTISIPPLAMPQVAAGATVDLSALVETPAVRMFVAEARAVQPGFEVTRDNAAAVAEVCVRVDGLPLALKLAAVRIKLLSPADIAARLQEHRSLLESGLRDVPARHRTLHRAISWSYDLLPPDERRAFRQLSVFGSPWTLEAAEAVLDRTDDLLGIVDSLIDKSLLQRVPSQSDTRFTMLDSLKEFAADQLAAGDELDATADRHLQYFAEISAVSEAVVGTLSEADWWEPMTLLERDVRAAADRAYEVDDGDAIAVMAAALGWHRYLRGQVGWGSGTVERALQSIGGAARPPTAGSTIALLTIGGVLGWARGDLDRAAELLRAAASKSQEIHDVRHEAIGTAFMGHVARDRGLLDVARVHHQRARLLYDELGNVRGSAWAGFDLGRTAWQAGELEQAAELFRESLTTFRRIDYHWAAAWTGWALGGLRLEQGDVPNGVALTLGSMETFESVADRRGVASCWESLAMAAGDRGLHHEAVQLLSAADQLRVRLLAPLTEQEAARLTSTEQASSVALGEYAAESAREAGRAMSVLDATALVRSVGSGLTRPNPDQDRLPDGVLTAREHDVAALVATGCTNQQIGSSLGITARTVEVHVRNIMGKLDVRSRSEIAVWMVTRR